MTTTKKANIIKVCMSWLSLCTSDASWLLYMIYCLKTRKVDFRLVVKSVQLFMLYKKAFNACFCSHIICIASIKSLVGNSR